MDIKAIVIGSILGIVLHYTMVAIGLLISYLMDKLFSKTGKTSKTKEQK